MQCVACDGSNLCLEFATMWWYGSRLCYADSSYSWSWMYTPRSLLFDQLC